MLCEENIFKNIYEDIGEENELDVGQEVEHEHIGEENELDVGVEYKVHNLVVKQEKMKPSLGELYEYLSQLRLALTSYAICKGYQL